MKTSYLILLLALFAFVGCNSSDYENQNIESDETKTELISMIYEQQWVLSEIKNEPVTFDREDQRMPYLVLRIEETRIMGYGGCNEFTGSFVLGDNDGIRFDQVAATKMYCQETMHIEDKFFAELKNTTSFKMDDEVLQFMNEDGDVILRLQMK